MTMAKQPLAAPTKALLHYLQQHPALRGQIAAGPGQTVAYAGSIGGDPAWLRLLRHQLGDPHANDFQMLPDVLKLIPCPPDLYKAVGLVTPPRVLTLLDYLQFITGDGPGYARQVPAGDAFVLWRAFSGIFMSNAKGRVRLLVGTVPNPQEKVFFVTEIFVLDRNPEIDMFAKGAVQQVRAQLRAGVIPGTIERL